MNGFGERMLRVVLPDDGEREALLGDLAEETVDRARTAGPHAAERWRRGQLYASLPPLAAAAARRSRPVDLAVQLAGAMLAGYATMALLVIASDGLLGLIFGRGPTTAMSIASLTLGAVSGVAGGWLAARVGRRAPKTSAALLGVAAVVLSVILLVNTDDGTPRWYRIGLAVEVLPAVLVGAWLYLRSGHDKP